MSGKVLVAVVAAAVSSASAATVGVVYTKIVGARHIEATVLPSELVTGPATVTSAVVLNASGSESFGDLPVDGDAPGCASAESGRCGAAAPGRSELQINILGKTLTIPPILLGNSEDQYTDTRFVWPAMPDLRPFEFRGRIGRHRASLSDLLDDAIGHDDAKSQSGAATSDGSSVTSSASASSDAGASNAVWSSIAVIASPPEMGSGLGGSIDQALALPILVSPSATVGLPDVQMPITDPTSVDSSVGSSPGDGFGADAVQPMEQSIGQQLFSPVPNAQVSGAVPEPSTWILTAAGFAALGFFKRRRWIAYLTSARD